MRAIFTRAVGLPLAAIFAMQTALTMGAYAFPVIMPVAAQDLGIAPESVGFLVATIYLVAMGVGLASGWALARLGPTRVFQALLGLSAAGALVLTAGYAWAAFAAAVLVGCSTGAMNPAGSTVLVRVATPDTRALIFSLKQCGTPSGGMLAGALLPALTLAYDWRVAMLAVAGLTVAIMILAPFGGLGGAVVAPVNRGGPARGPLQSLRLVISDPAIRAVTITGFGLAICQMGLATYLVVFLWRSAGFSPAEAGLIFAVLHVSGIASRIALGFIADRLLSARWALALIGAAMSAALLVALNITSAWPIGAVCAVVAIAGASGNGWVGLYFAELARLAPADRVADVTAGSQFMTYLGIVCGPLLFGALLRATDSYPACFLFLAVVALLCALHLALAGAPTARSES